MRKLLLAMLLVLVVSPGQTNAQEKPPKVAIRALQTLPILATDDGLVKLQKQKVNAAVSELNAMFEAIVAGGRGGLEGAELAGAAARVKDAVLDLNDPKLTEKTVNDYVALMADAVKAAELRVEAGVASVVSLHRMRYYYLDAQILQLRHKKRS